MWKKLKENWKTYLLLLLSALFGADQTAQFIGSEEVPAVYAATDGSTWTITAWLVAEKSAGGGATPAVKYTDNLGLYTVKVNSPSRPTDAEIIAAVDKGLNPEAVSVKVIAIEKPGGKVEPLPDEPDIK